VIHLVFVTLVLNSYYNLLQCSNIRRDLQVLASLQMRKKSNSFSGTCNWKWRIL